MSANKLKYYTVTRTSIIKANSKTEAMETYDSQRGRKNNDFFFDTLSTERVMASEAQETAGLREASA